VQPVILTIDKPFVFFLRDSATGTILFQGRYVGS
jgi:serine protease inhibitor